MITKVNLNVNTMFFCHIAIFFLLIAGILPRTVVPYWTLALTAYVLLASLEDSTAFFVRSIPFFIAIPITGGFDSLNMWRILSCLIFIKWFLGLSRVAFKYDRILKLQIVWRNHKATILLLGILILAILSATQADSTVLAVKRIVYFINLSLIGVIIYDLVKKNQDFSQRLIKNIAIPTIIVALIGILQQISTYYMDIFQFVDFWGGVVQRNLFGNAWADTAIRANTWFAYFGDQLSLRMFSIFPDSHSFPIFLLLGLPTVLALALERVFKKNSDHLKVILKTRANILVVFVPIIFLAAILSGTRGIWAAGATSTIWAGFLLYRHRKPLNKDLRCRYIFSYLASYLTIFFLLFGPAYYILATDQFQMA